MAGDKDEGTGKKSRGGLVKVALCAVFLLVAVAGGAYAAVASGAFGDSGPSGPDLPEFVLKGESDPYALPTSDKDDEVSIVYGDGGSEYRTAYYSFDDSFTANLADSPALIQVELAVSTRRDGRVLQWVQAHELAIRSAILGQLAATSESDIYSVEGKEALAVRLAQAVNAVLEETEGFGGVDAVHFKGILVQ